MRGFSEDFNKDDATSKDNLQWLSYSFPRQVVALSGTLRSPQKPYFPPFSFTLQAVIRN